MVWWEETREYLYESGLEDPQDNRTKTFFQHLDDIFFKETVDALYFFLGIFTYVYLFTIAFLYLSGISNVDSIATKLVRALAEPYLGSVGVYTILKESRKRKRGAAPRHWGEFFVAGWLLLLALSAALALISGFYTFTKTLELIIMISLSVGIIYIGGAVHKP